MRIATALATLFMALAAVPLAFSSHDTTSPGIVYTLPAVLTDNAIEVGETLIPRGTVIRYLIVNRGSRPYALRIASTATRPIPPRGRARLQITWNRRGRFTLRTLYRGKPVGPRRSITVI